MSSRAIHIFDRPHREASRLVASGAPVFLSVNPVEYHGPHLSLHNDRLVSLGLIGDLHEALAADHDWPLLVASDLEVGVEPCLGAGTRRTRYRTARAAVIEACRAIAELGAQRVVLMTFHGAPLHNLALEAGVDWLRERGVVAAAPFHVVLRQMLLLDGVDRFADALDPIDDPDERAAMAAELPRDFHAGFFETSMTLHYAPDSVSPEHRDLPPCPPVTPEPRFVSAAALAAKLGRQLLARELEFAAHGLGWNALRPFPGYTSRPHLASAAAGAAFARHILDDIGPALAGVLDGSAEPPAPIMRWIETLTLGGRVSQP